MSSGNITHSFSQWQGDILKQPQVLHAQVVGQITWPLWYAVINAVIHHVNSLGGSPYQPANNNSNNNIFSFHLMMSWVCAGACKA